MGFDSLSDRLTIAMRNIAGNGKLTDKNMDRMLKEVRSALLDADVNYLVVKDFVARIRKEYEDMEVTPGLDPAEQVVTIVRDAIEEILGKEPAPLEYSSGGITVIMMVGLQGTGKTTSAVKLAKFIRDRQSRKPLLVAADVKRPAAIEQLQTLASTVDVEVFSLGPNVSALETSVKAVDYAKEKGYNTVIIDTAGRLAIDEALMKELTEIRDAVDPEEILLTVDAMTGQSIVHTAETFHEKIGCTGLIVTKFDSDARGGGVFSVRAVTSVPVKFVGSGEKVDDIDIFYPDRVASRILGMGDILTLVEQAQEKIDLKESEASAERMMKGQFTLDDMMVQYKQMRKLGPLSGIMKMIPGLNQFASQIDDDDTDKKMKVQMAIINSMTPEERKDPTKLRGTHKTRIAKGSGTTVNDVNQLINAYVRAKKQMSMLGSMFRGKMF